MPALSSVNLGRLQGSDELSPTAAVLSNAEPHSAVEWKAGRPTAVALAGAQGKLCAPEAKGFTPLPRAGTLGGSSKITLEFLGLSRKDTQTTFF